MERILAVTKAKREIADITGDVVDLIRDLNLRDGLCNLFVMHTTCALTIADRSIMNGTSNPLPLKLMNSL